MTTPLFVYQNRMARRAERRSHLGLQVSMLAEQEITTMLQMQQKLCQHLGLDVESTKEAVERFSKTMDVQKLATELEEKLPGQ